MEYKVFEQADLKVLSDGTGSLSGYASTWEPWDRVGEKPVRGAFAAALPGFLKDGFIAYGHQWGQLPIATPTEAYEDEHGLFFRADFHSTQFAQEARITVTERIERGKSVLTSIGYAPPEIEAVDAPDLPGGRGTLLKVIPLLEISVVPVPANPAALLTGAKAAHLLTGWTLAETSDLALTAVGEFTTRCQEIAALRAKEGRVLSTANREKLAGLRGSLADVLTLIEQLLTETAPKSAPDPILEQYLRFLNLQARALGVPIP
jgi:HK97 family phage prohead protease